MERILEYRCHLQGPRRPSEAVMFSCENMVTERVKVASFLKLFQKLDKKNSGVIITPQGVGVVSVVLGAYIVLLKRILV